MFTINNFLLFLGFLIQFTLFSQENKSKTEGLDTRITSRYEQYRLPEPNYIPGVVDSIAVNSENLTVLVDGVPTVFTFSCPTCVVVIQDDDGMQYVVSHAGIVSTTSYFEVSSEMLEVNNNQVVRFDQHATEVFGFDKKEHTPWHADYEIIRSLDSINYFVANKSLGKGVADKVSMTFPVAQYANPNFTFNIKNSNLAVTAVAEGSGKYTVNIPAIAEAGKYELYVKANGLNVGKLNIHVYEDIVKKVRIVPLANTTVTDAAITAALQQTLGEANITVELNRTAIFKSPLYNDTTTFKVPDANLVTKYSAKMRDLRDYYLDTITNYDQDGYLIFVVNNLTDSAGLPIDGYMVRGRGLGFVSTTANANTFAHELAHGIGGLQHTWLNNGPAQGSTQNLMDYTSTGSANNLTKAQWKELRDIDLAASFWDEEEDFETSLIFYDSPSLVGAFSEDPTSLNCNKFLTDSKSFVTFTPLANLKLNIENQILNSFETISSSGNILYTASNSVQLDNRKSVVSKKATTRFISFGTFVESNFITVQQLGQNETRAVKIKISDNSWVYFNIPSKFIYSNITTSACTVGSSYWTGSDCKEITQFMCDNLNQTSTNTSSTETNPTLSFYSTTLCSEPARNGSNLLLPDGTPVKTTGFINVYSNIYLNKFTKNNVLYKPFGKNIGSDGITFLGFIDSVYFSSLTDKKLLSLDPTKVMLTASFPNATMGEIIDVKYYYNNDYCCYRTYGIRNTKTKYVFNDDISTIYAYDATPIIINNSSCSQFFTGALCEGFSRGFKGFEQIVAGLTNALKIDEKYYDLLSSSYDPTLYSYYSPLGNSSPVEFAGMCGMINEAVNIVQGVSQLGTLVTELFCTEGFKDSLYNMMAQLGPHIKDAFNREIANEPNIYKRAEAIGRASLIALSVIVPLTKVNWATKVAFLKTVAKEVIYISKKIKPLNLAITFTRRTILNGTFVLMEALNDGRFIVNRWSTSNSTIVHSIGIHTFRRSLTANADEVAELALVLEADGTIGVKVVNGAGKFAKYTKVDGWLKGITNVTSRANVENIIKNWSDDLLTKLDNVPSRNPNFLSQVEANPSILNHFEDGASVISSKGSGLKPLELDMYALDKARTTDVVFDGAGNYITNPTKKNLAQMDINAQSGKIRDANGNIMVTDNVNGEGLMFVIDDADNIFIGGRNNANLPHPTLIGGKNPNVKCAGMIRFKDGRILEISNNSGHFKPSNSALQQADAIFKQKMPTNSFDSQFKTTGF